MKRIYVCFNNIDTKALDILSEVAHVTIREAASRPDEDELCSLVANYDILLTGVKSRFTDRVYASAKKVQLIGTVSVGLDHISPLFFADPKIEVVSCTVSNAVSVAEHTLAFMFALSKRVIPAHDAVLSGSGRSHLVGKTMELAGKTLGVIGAGNVGREVITRSKALRMKILCSTLHPEKHVAEVLDAKFVDIEQILAESDFITLHLPLNSTTDGLLNRERLESLKPGAFIINTSRTGLVDNQALASRIKEGHIGGAGIDLDQEDTETIGYFKGIEQVILAPHISGLSNESLSRMDMEISKKIAHFLLSS